VFGKKLGSCLCEHSHRNILRYCHRLTKGFDSLQLMHCLRRKIRFSTDRARPHRNALNHKKIHPLTENSRHVLQMNLTAATMGAVDWAILTGFVKHHWCSWWLRELTIFMFSHELWRGRSPPKERKANVFGDRPISDPNLSAYWLNRQDDKPE
jgi:hypothetical protein